MQNKSKTKFIFSGISGILFILLIALLKCVDVAKIVPTGAANGVTTEIGFSHINQAVHEFFGVNMFWYTLTQLLGYFSILVMGFFAFIGLLQLIKRKNLLKIDKEILALAGLYAVVVGVYAIFEVIVINYRPIIMEGAVKPEASFPSSHTMLICVVMASTIMLLKRYIKVEKLAVALQFFCGVAIAVTVFGRLACGVHWFTDIIGGVLISLALVFLYWGVLDIIRAKKKKARKAQQQIAE